MNEWYSALNKPPLTPPNWIFGPVWTVLYIMIAISIILYYRAAAKPHLALTSAVLIVHIISNLVWTPLFFKLHSPAIALIDIVLLDVTLAILICWFWKSSVVAGGLLIPYFAWVMFATYLNAGFYTLNCIIIAD